ncbi:MAG: hypothetical protein H6741_22240 [Alphaproteobacteria bacterium]|nr:hypothetical protein [Alphaproteobacteria bacterium]
MSALPSLLLLLLACGGKDAPRTIAPGGEDSAEDSSDDSGNADDSAGVDDSSEADDSGRDTSSSGHPLVPEAYQNRWDIDGCGERGVGAMHYRLAEAASDASGQIQISVRSFIFRGGEWSDDCVDTLAYAGEAIPHSENVAMGASEAEEGYRVSLSVLEDQCGLGREEGASAWYLFDTLSPSGNPNYENAMLVYRFIEGESGPTLDGDYARGVFSPDTSVLGPPAHYTWLGERCVMPE